MREAKSGSFFGRISEALGSAATFERKRGKGTKFIIRLKANGKNDLQIRRIVGSSSFLTHIAQSNFYIAFCFFSIGNETMNFVPFPASVSNVTAPSIASVNLLTAAKPKP